MPYYKDFNDKQKKPRSQRMSEGGWENEGSRYSNSRDRKVASTAKPDRQYGDRPYGDKKPYGDKPYGEKRSFGDKKPYGEKSYGDKRPYGDKKPYGEKRSFGDAPRGGFDRKPSFDSHPSRGGYKPSNRPMDAKPAFERRPAPRPVPVAPAYNEPEAENMPPENLLTGRNPIREALKEQRDIEKIMVARGDLSGSAREIISMAKEQHVIVQEVDRSRLDAVCRNHQGMVAFTSAYQYSDVESMMKDARDKGEDPFLIILDGVTDPHNLGAVIRTAACVGAHGVIVPQRRAVGLTPAAVKAASGGEEHIRVARVTNLNRTIEELKKQGVWMYAADMEGEDYRKVNFAGPCALVIGSEGDGISRLTLEMCDHTVKLPMTGSMESLNASVAAGVLMYAVVASR